MDDARICWFGAQRLAPLHKAFTREITGVRRGTDPEHIHRMRVASRRLRIAIPLFAACFPQKKFRRWLKKLKNVSRALSLVRDTDVQILFLGQYLQHSAQDSVERETANKILESLMEYRATCQSTVISTLDALEQSDVLLSMSVAIKQAGTERAKERGVQQQAFLLRSAAAPLTAAWERFLSHGSSVRVPEDISGHHALRIAAKKLRYTLEIYRPLHPDRFKPAISILKTLQEILGSLHDCDVWIQELSNHEPLTTGLMGESGPTRFVASNTDARGVAAILQNRIEARKEIHALLVSRWEKDVEGFLLDSMSSVVIPAKAHRDYGGATSVNSGDGRKKPETCRDEDSHAGHVTELALMLFDELAPLHGYGKKERRILKNAAHLHDIGWVHGQKKHHVWSGRMILEDTSLPFSSPDRAIIALVARLHTKRVPERLPRSFSSLKPKAVRTALMLASILRIADGLDYTRSDRTKSLSCRISPDAVICYPLFQGYGSMERERALKKSDLFEKMFSRRFLIP